ncbi:MAG TPA: hypothetical protein VF015_13925, partial [Acidimicrobiales bacterium]
TSPMPADESSPPADDDNDPGRDPGPPRDDEGASSGGPAGTGVSPAYRPPPSPAYAEPASPLPRIIRRAPDDRGPRRTSPAGAAATEDAPTRESRRDTTRADRFARRGRQLLVVGSALVIVTAGLAAVAIVTGGDGEYTFGQIATVRGEAVVLSDETDDEARPLEVGETVRAGWAVELPDDAAVTVELDDGGVARFDSGARVAFVDSAVDPETHERTGASKPAIEVSEGRAWVNPGAGDAAPVEIHLPTGAVASAGNPLALDCTAACTVEAPAGGVSLATGTDPEIAPAANEVVTLDEPDILGVIFADGPSAWARQNLDADREAGLPEPRPDDEPGIRRSAVLDGTYRISIKVVGEPTGDAIPRALQYRLGETYGIELTADGGGCTSGTCSVPVVAPDGASGSAQVDRGSVALSLGQPIDCYDETYTSVVVPQIGTTTVIATLDVTDAEHVGERWLVSGLDGGGSVATTLTTACNRDDTLGTSTSRVDIEGD